MRLRDAAPPPLSLSPPPPTRVRHGFARFPTEGAIVDADSSYISKITFLFNGPKSFSSYVFFLRIAGTLFYLMSFFQRKFYS